ncbi:hypothetical protein J3Q64DRAFT_1019051 [Phycomyces blakesleeanus]|uniref:Uncharacterized protein n=1 Tax=Phycomyces blakesleeanus TaxID=4837 RepID=A0ABR3BC17_PHYBL
MFKKITIKNTYCVVLNKVPVRPRQTKLPVLLPDSSAMLGLLYINLFDIIFCLFYCSRSSLLIKARRRIVHFKKIYVNIYIYIYTSSLLGSIGYTKFMENIMWVIWSETELIKQNKSGSITFIKRCGECNN